MAESENADAGDPFLQNLNVIPARKIVRESQLEQQGKDVRKRGFNKLRVVVVESVFGKEIMAGSGILCPSVDDWPEFGEEIDDYDTGYDFQWVLTAAHCVAMQRRSRCRLPDRMRIRIPKYRQWPSKKLNSFRAGAIAAMKSNRFEDIVLTADEIQKYVHVYDPYKAFFSSTNGEDFALIQIPVFQSTVPPNTFQVWDASRNPEGFSIAGFPADADKVYLPYFDRRKEFSGFDPSPRNPDHTQMYYTSVTSGGQSGGPVQFVNLEDNYRAVVGIHVTGKTTTDSEASGCLITKKVSEWIRSLQKQAVKIEKIPQHVNVSSPKVSVTSKKQNLNHDIDEKKRNEIVEDGTSMSSETVFEIGDSVMLEGNRFGELKFIGETDFAKGVWYGVELSGKQKGNNSGSVNGKRYFQCWRRLAGVFVKVNKIQPNVEKLSRELKAACGVGDDGLAKKLISKGANVEWSDERGRTPVLQSTDYGHVSCLQLLYEHGADLSTPDKFGCTPVFGACALRKLKCLKFLAEHGANLSTPCNDGSTPVWIASRNGNLEGLKFLAEHGVNLSTPANDGCTPVWIASQEGQLECLKFLVEHGASLTTPLNGVTPYKIARIKGHLDCAEFIKEKMLLNCGIPIRKDVINSTIFEHLDQKAGCRKF